MISKTVFSGILFVSAIAGVGLAFARPAQSQTEMCGVRGDIIQRLSQDFKEEPQSVGMVDKGAVVEVFVSDAGTWTILATRTDGTSCIVSAGEGWESKNFVAGKDA